MGACSMPWKGEVRAESCGGVATAWHLGAGGRTDAAGGKRWVSHGEGELPRPAALGQEIMLLLLVESN